MKNYFNDIKQILDNSKIYDLTDTSILYDSNPFYFFQYPSHFVEFFGSKRWKLFEKVYLSNKVKGLMNMPIRWKHINPTHINGNRVLDLGCNIGAELYFIKNLYPSYLLGLEYNDTAIELAKLSIEMHQFKKFDIMKYDLINEIDNVKLGKFDIVILSGSLLSYNPDYNFREFNNYMKKLCTFIKETTLKYFYFLSLDKYHFNYINDFFNGKIKINTVLTYRIVRQLNGIESKEFILDRYRDEFYGYVEVL
jgi:SAM-dependent methyltransferase